MINSSPPNILMNNFTIYLVACQISGNYIRVYKWSFMVNCDIELPETTLLSVDVFYIKCWS